MMHSFRKYFWICQINRVVECKFRFCRSNYLKEKAYPEKRRGKCDKTESKNQKKKTNTPRERETHTKKNENREMEIKFNLKYERKVVQFVICRFVYFTCVFVSCFPMFFLFVSSTNRFYITTQNIHFECRLRRNRDTKIFVEIIQPI